MKRPARPRRGASLASERIWSLAATGAEPALRLLLRRRLARGKEVRARVIERRGLPTSPRPEGRLLWLHAASVGETVSLLSLIEALCALDDGLHILMTTGSLTSERLLSRRLGEMGLLGRVQHQFVPLDVPRWIRRFLDHWRPQALALVESELWPNLLRLAREAGLPTALLNARMSERSLRGWRRAPGLSARMLGGFRWIAARSEEDAIRLRQLGAGPVGSPPVETLLVETLGDLKASAPPLAVDPAELARLQALLAGRPAWLAASTHAGEEPAVAEAHARLGARIPGVLSLVAPRHPERGAELAALLGGAPRRALGQDPRPDCGFWVCDTLGEMGLLFRLAGTVFVGNSLQAASPGGGHNPFEPARLGAALATGPRYFNFNDAVRDLAQAEALTVVDGAEALACWAGDMLSDKARREAASQAAAGVAGSAASLAPVLAARLLTLVADGPPP